MQNIHFTNHSDPVPLVAATLGLASQLEVNEILQEFVTQACQLTQSQYGVLALVDTGVRRLL